jgi:hypothetical protein
MPRALPLALRQQIVALRQQGEPLVAIAQQMGLKYRSVYTCWRRFRKAGAAGLQLHYKSCGPQSPRFAPWLQEEAFRLKREHPRWGATLVRLQLGQRFANERLPGERTLQYWWQRAGLQPPRAKQPPVPRQRGRTPHEVWQIDAKERMHLGDGTGSCVLSVTDEASGALVGLVPFSPLPLVAGARRRRAGGSEASV